MFKEMKYIYPFLLGVSVFFIGIFLPHFFKLYALFPHIDKVFHFCGGFALGWFFYLYFQDGLQSFPKFKQILIVISATCFVAVIWEYVERLSTVYAPHYLPILYKWIRGGDLNDTLLDIFAGIVGSLVFMFFSFSRE